MKNKLIYECHYCGDTYCGECSDNDDWEVYCSEKCENEAKDEKSKD